MPARWISLSTWIYAVCFIFAGLVSAQPYAYVANAGGTVAVINTSAASVAASMQVPTGPAGIAVTPDGTTFYVSSTNTSIVTAVNTASNSVVATIKVAASPVQVAASPAGPLVYVIHPSSNLISVINTSSNQVTATIPVGSHPVSVAFSPDGTRAYVANLWSNNVSVIDTAQNSVVNTFPTGAAPAAIAFASGKVYVCTQNSNTVSVHDPAGNALTTIGGVNFPTAIAATPNGSRLFVVLENINSVAVIDTSSDSVVTNITVGRLPNAVAVSTDGSQAFVTNLFSFSVSVIDVGSNSLSKTINGVGVYPGAIATIPPRATNAPPPPPPTPTCNYSFAAPGISIGPGGYSGSVSVNAPGNCSWNVSSNSSWINITGGASGTGNGSVSFNVLGNSGVGGRSGALAITNNGASFGITQGGAAFSPIRVNCGGPALTDSSGNQWQADPGHGYAQTTANIQNADIPALYQKEAFAAGNGLSYQFNVPNGTFTVKLRFAEIYLPQAGLRSMNIVINGTTVQSNFDILRSTSPNTAYDLTFPTSVTNGQVSIQIIPVTGTAKISGIEIY